jgi:hypothetical protein
MYFPEFFRILASLSVRRSQLEQLMANTVKPPALQHRQITFAQNQFFGVPAITQHAL